MTLDKLKDEEFALFLRGFSSDYYEPKMLDKLDVVHQTMNFQKKRKIDVATLPFSECDFAKAAKPLMPVYSVGMTKEVDSPEGTKRIYLDDEDWKDGVKLLIEKAKLIFILVNNSDSCIWEVMLCQELAIDKTIFFVDNPEQMDAIKNKLEYKQIPECIRNFTGKHTYHFMVDNESHSFVYTNNKEGFINVLNVYLKYSEQETRRKEEEIKKRQESLAQPDYSRYMPH